MNQTNTLMMVAIFLVAALAIGLVVIPAIHEAHARSIAHPESESLRL